MPEVKDKLAEVKIGNYYAYKMEKYGKSVWFDEAGIVNDTRYIQLLEAVNSRPSVGEKERPLDEVSYEWVIQSFEMLATLCAPGMTLIDRDTAYQECVQRADFVAKQLRKLKESTP